MYGHRVNRIWKIALLAVAAFSVASCCEKENVNQETLRSVLIYMAGNNNLSSDLIYNIESLKQGFLPYNGNILIYLDVPNKNPVLLKLVKNKATNSIVTDTIAKYGAGEHATDPAVLTKTLNYMRDHYPAKEYGLILSSHGTGWLPAGLYTYQSRASVAVSHVRKDVPDVKTFGEYPPWGDKGMDIKDMAAAIPFRLSFILFDACLMGGIEVLYAMRNVTDYVVAAPTEIMSSGFPYNQIMQPLFLPNPDYKGVCNTFFNYYSTHPGGASWQYATIALYHTEALQELAGVVKAIFRAHRTALNQFSPGEVQYYDRLWTHLFFDFAHFIGQLATPSEYALFKAALDKVVIHKRATDFFMTTPINQEHFSGISTFIPSGVQSAYRDGYKLTDWNHAVQMLEYQ